MLRKKEIVAEVNISEKCSCFGRVLECWLFVSGEMTSSEIAQSILDIKSWFLRSDRKLEFESASTVDIQRLEKAIDTQLPSTLKILLQECNGGLYFMDKRQLAAIDIMDAVSNAEGSSKWKHGLIPFCGDESGYFVIDTSDGDSVYEWDSDDGLGDRVGSNITRYLENYRNELLENHFEYLQDVGVVEKVTKGHK